MKLTRTLLKSSFTIKNTQKLIGNDHNILKEDKYLIRVKAGSGGNGLARYNGIGGRGGNVFLVPKSGMAFSDIKKQLNGHMKVKATPGESSEKMKLVGQDGKDEILHVPLGVEAVDEARNILLARCNKFQKYLVANGGLGGCKDNEFRGEKGEELDIALHLKLRPNVGLVGFPNAGKSTLLKAFIPQKSVKIAPYPFTTETPQVGFWNAKDIKDEDEDEEFTLSIADLPGIIEGAAKNRGKGHKFLKHLEFCDIILMVVDCTGFQLANKLDEPYRSPLESVALLNRELEEYDEKLTQKPAVLVVNKVDIARDSREPERFAVQMRMPGWEVRVPDSMRPRHPLIFDYVLPTSAKRGDVSEVKRSLLALHKAIRPVSVPPTEEEGDKFI